jgi:hypothetical protein
VDTIDFFDGVGSDILVQTRQLSSPNYNNNKVLYETKEEIVRILSKTNGLYQDN